MMFWRTIDLKNLPRALYSLDSIYKYHNIKIVKF